ncbi:hypothetical protein [Roseobacter sp.]|uniref:hypothetical protein n=1 Tax=Roseobacter sp. TaxID=1907202 RepID=UPI0032991178
MPDLILKMPDTSHFPHWVLTAFDDICETLSVPISIADPCQNDTPLHVDSAFERLSQYSSAEAVGHNARFMQGEFTDRTMTNDVDRSTTLLMACHFAFVPT